MVLLFGIVIVPLGGVSIFLIVIQPRDRPFRVAESATATEAGIGSSSKPRGAAMAPANPGRA
jgi:hypothetical protein